MGYGKKTGTPFRKLAIEQQQQQYQKQVEALLTSDFITRTDSGFEINILKLVDSLSKQKKATLVEYLTQ